MNRHAFDSTLLLASMLIASGAFAGSEITKCIDAAGHITLTDQACEDGSAAASMSAVASESAAPEDVPAAAPASRVVPERVVVAPAKLGGAMRGKARPVPRRSFALDVAMLKVARLNLQLADHAASVMRQQRLAGM